MDIVLENICKSFSGVKVLDSISAVFREGEVTGIMGPSGCGKTTLLGIIAGLVPPDSGSICGTEGRRMAFSFQEPRLLPWKSVMANVEFTMPGDMSPSERSAGAMRCLEVVELTGAAAEIPASLSGGMAQRVSLARALAPDADILLLDEPFSAIDDSLKGSIMPRLKSLWKEHGTTVIMVTHCVEEAAFFGDYINLC